VASLATRLPRFSPACSGGRRLTDADLGPRLSVLTVRQTKGGRFGHSEQVSNRRLQRPRQRLATVRASLRRWADWLDELEAHPLDFYEYEGLLLHRAVLQTNLRSQATRRPMPRPMPSTLGSTS
jgi:hypothetical protein